MGYHARVIPSNLDDARRGYADIWQTNPPDALFLVPTILALAGILVWQQRKEERLRTALAIYKSRSMTESSLGLRGGAPTLDWPDLTPLTAVIEQIKLCTQTGRPTFPLGIPVAVDLVGLGAGRQVVELTGPTAPVEPGPLTGAKAPVEVLEPLGIAFQGKGRDHRDHIGTAGG